jgi:hypothetical protein
MKKLLSTSFLLFICAIANATGIYGKVVNQDDKPFAGIEVILLDSNKTALAKILTNVDGDFGFIINEKRRCHLVVHINDSVFQEVDDIQGGIKDWQYNFVFTQKYFSRDKNSSVISASEIEKLPTLKLTDQLATQGNFDRDANGNLRSRTLGNGVQLIVDGQVISNSNQLQLVPSSVGSMEVIKR